MMNKYTIEIDVDYLGKQNTELARKVLRRELLSLERRIEIDVANIRNPERIRANAAEGN